MAKKEAVELERPAVRPPLSQSRYELMGCEKLYVTREVEGVQSLDNEFSFRGRVVHTAIADYVQHLVDIKRKTDYEYFDRITGDASGDAATVLASVKESYFFEPTEVMAVEQRIWLDADFKNLGGNSAKAAHAGTIDLLLRKSPTAAVIHDWKSYWQIIDADTFQSKYYPLLVFSVYDEIEEVTFVLNFVRYGDAQRSVTYTRDDIPKLQKLANEARSRQASLHVIGTSRLAQIGVTPGRHCTYCPLLTNGCPLQETNPYAELTPAQRVAFGVWLQEATEANTKILKDFMAEGGPQSYRDANGVEYRSEFRRVEKKFYPLIDSYLTLGAWAKARDEWAFLGKLTVGGLSSPLKALKRAELAEAMSRLARTTNETHFKIGRPKEPVKNGDEPMIAQSDSPEIFDWIINASSFGGDFVQNVAEAALYADSENYPIIRPVVLQLIEKYPDYKERRR